MSTNIEWVTNPDGSKGETWPVVTGCSPVSPGCRNCYAARMAATRLKHHPRYEGLAVMRAPGMPRWTGEVRLNHDVLEQPFHWRKPRMIFVASMGDLFHEDVPFEFISKVFTTMKACRARRLEHIFLVLTKRPNRMLEYWKWWRSFCVSDEAAFKYHDCIWLGVSVENQATADERIPLLLQTPAAVRFVNCEPLLGGINLLPWLRPYPNCGNVAEDGTCASLLNPTPECHLASCPMTDIHRGISWCVAGGESGPNARPMHPDWVRSIRDQCQVSSTPFFMKQWGAWIPFGQGKGPEIPERTKECWLDIRGQSHPTYSAMMHQPSKLWRVGKKRAGHLLDDVLYEEYPKGKERRS